LIKKINHIRN